MARASPARSRREGDNQPRLRAGEKERRDALPQKAEAMAAETGYREVTGIPRSRSAGDPGDPGAVTGARVAKDGDQTPLSSWRNLESSAAGNGVWVA